MNSKSIAKAGSRLWPAFILGISLWIYPLFALFAENPASHDLGSTWRYTDVFRQDNPGEASGYLYALSSDTAWDIVYRGQRLSCGYHFSDLRGKLRRLASGAGSIGLEMPNSYLRLGYSVPLAQKSLHTQLDLGATPGLGLGLETPSWQTFFSLHRQRAEINYDIGTDSGEIPFDWAKAELSFAPASTAHFPKINLSAIIPMDRDSLYENSLHIYQAGIAYDAPISDLFRTNLQANYLHASARLRYKKETYGKLDQLNLLSTGAELIQENKHFSYHLGINSYHSRLGEDSYFDIWPFSAWDAFLAHRTRIKRFDIDSISPFAGIDCQNQAENRSGLRYTLAAYCHHHFSAEDLLIRNRRVVLYPFLFSYEDLDFELTERIDAHLQLNAGLSYALRASSIKLDITQLAPIKWSKIKDLDIHPEPSAAKTRQWGGTAISLSLNFSF